MITIALGILCITAGTLLALGLIIGGKGHGNDPQ